MKTTSSRFLVAVLASLAVLLFMTTGVHPVYGQAQAVRWDIVSLNPATNPPTLNPGGVAFAAASNPNTLTIKLRGSGTFVAPSSGGTSHAVTGGGTWETFAGGISTGRGTYEVTSLASWQFDNLQTGSFIDNIDDGTRANGNAVLRIRYSDGSEGILGIGCHGPGADPGIEEGVIATKSRPSPVTYWTGQAPVPGVNANRTVFHLMR
jgi:hypothetical protein